MFANLASRVGTRVAQRSFATVAASAGNAAKETGTHVAKEAGKRGCRAGARRYGFGPYRVVKNGFVLSLGGLAGYQYATYGMPYSSSSGAAPLVQAQAAAAGAGTNEGSN